MSDAEDVELLRSWSSGDRRAGEVLYDRYFDIVYRFFRSKVPESTQDLTQVTMVELIKSSSRWRGTGSFRSFVLGIAYNVLRHHLRSRTGSRIELSSELGSCEWLGLGPFELVSGTEMQKLLVKALRRIPIEHQIIVELYYWEDLKFREIGEVLGVPSSTVRTRQLRAKVLLRRELTAIMKSGQGLESTLVGLRTWAADLRKQVGGIGLGSPADPVGPPPAHGRGRARAREGDVDRSATLGEDRR